MRADRYGGLKRRKTSLSSDFGRILIRPPAARKLLDEHGGVHRVRLSDVRQPGITR